VPGGSCRVAAGLCGSIDAHYSFGVALLVVGGLAFVGGMVGLFVLQQHNAKAWRQAGPSIVAGLFLGIFAVAALIILAIVRSVRESATTSAASAANAESVSRPVREQPADVGASARQLEVQWRVGSDGWEWLASDGRWYPQQLAPARLLPPAPPPPAAY
jgi:hypothetical protein